MAHERPYGCFSNFYKHSFQLDGLKWPTSEHYYQAQKFQGIDPRRLEYIRLAPDPMTAKNLGNDHDVPIRRDWDLVRDEVMRRAILRKFETENSLRKILVETGDAPLVEMEAGGPYWSAGEDGRGLNRLGQILMEVREILKARIYFYDKDQPYYCFSNFSPYSLTLDAREWPSAEHYYQAQKFLGTPLFEKVQQADYARSAFFLAQENKKSTRPDWTGGREDVMRRAVLAKFTQNLEIQAILASTGSKLLIEASPVDGFWGAGPNGDGRNRLGVILMEVREIIRVRREGK